MAITVLISVIHSSPVFHRAVAPRVHGVEGKSMTLLYAIAGCIALLLLIYLLAALLRPEWFG